MGRTVRRIEVSASLEAEPDEELARVRHAAEEGDESWRRWLTEYEQGGAMLLRLKVSMLIEHDGQEETISRTNRSLWVEDHAHPPKVEQQIAELAPKDFEEFVPELEARGFQVGIQDLEQMFVAVKLGDDIVEHLGSQRRHLGEGVQARPGLTTDSK